MPSVFTGPVDVQDSSFDPARASHRIKLQRKSVTRGPGGEELVSWINLITDTADAAIWAEVWPLKGREFFAAQQTQYAADVRFRIRYRPGLEAEHRVIWNSQPYDIVSIVDVGAARHTIEILAINGVRHGL